MTISTKQWIIDPDSTNKLTITSSILPELSPNQVLVKVHAVSLNYRDKLEIENFPTNNMTQPFTPTSDMAGEVIQIGTEVTQFSVGDKVINSFYQEWLNGHFHGTLTQKIKTFGTSALNGVLSEYVVFSVENLVRLPRNLSYIEASTLACAAVTAWQALIKEGHLKAGETVVIQGTGGVAIFALQFALAHGANCIVISSDNRKLAKLEQLGPIHKINRTKIPDWHVKVAELTNQMGAEHILELAAGDNLNKSISAVSFHGNIYIIGVLNGYETKINIQPLLYKKPKLHGIGVGPKQTLIDVSKAIETLELKPHIDQVYAFQDAEKAFAHLYRGAFGKIVIRVSEDS